MRIGNKLVGDGEAVYIVAEIGVNHCGDLGMARRLIDAARQAGADAVKFQIFSADGLATSDAPTCAYQQGPGVSAANQQELLRSLELRPDDFARLKAHADERGIDFLATPFGINELCFLTTLGPPAIKIASPDVVNEPLLEAAAGTALPIILSTGASTQSELDQTVELLHRLGAAKRTMLLHCVSAYPTEPSRAGLARIASLRRRYALPVGFSDHSGCARLGAWAVAAGAVILEAHVTLDRGVPGPDHFFSLEPMQFAEYVAGAREAHSALGSGRIDFGEEEAEVRKLARGSIVASADIQAGEALRAEALTVRRPGGGIAPNQWSSVVGLVSRTYIPANTRLTWTMLEGEAAGARPPITSAC